MAIARVGTGSGDNTAGGVTSLTIPYTPSATGNLLALMGSFGGSGLGAVTVADNTSTSWTVRSASGPTFGDIAIVAYRENIPSGITSVTLTFGVTAFGHATVEEFSGVATSSSQDGAAVTATAASPASTLGSGNLTATGTTDLILAAAGADDSANTAWTTTLGSFTEIINVGDSNSSHPTQTAFQIASGSTGPFALTWTYTPGSSDMESVLVAFLAAGAGAPTINTQPQPVTVYQGQAAVFTISATTSGGALSYQWKQNGSNVGTNSSTLTITPTTLSDNGTSITCSVSDSNGTTVSSAALLTVIATAVTAWLRA